MHLVNRQTCRICGSRELVPVIDLGEQYLQGAFVTDVSGANVMRKISTQLVRCDPSKNETGCGLLQTAVSVPPEILYSSYWYRSGTNRTMRNHLAEIVHRSLEMCRTADKDIKAVLDIGCNDGTLLSNYPKTISKFGIDPSDVAASGDNEFTLISDLFPSAKLSKKGTKFDIITSIAMFYDLEDPNEFVSEICKILNKDGLWVFEMSYMPHMLEANSYDTICHEHIEYYSLAVIENLLKRHQLRVVGVELNTINGGSIRCYATHNENEVFDTKERKTILNNIRCKEFDLKLDTNLPYELFQSRIIEHREALKNMLITLKREGKSIHVYGASTKGNTILQWCGLDSGIIDVAADRNPEKHGTSTLGTNIPIVSEEESRSLLPDYYLVLPWHFKDEFLEREMDIRAQGTKFIFPLPQIEII